HDRRGDHAAERCGEAGPMTPGYDRDAPGRFGGLVERRPDLERRITVETPVASAVLMPREHAPSARSLGDQSGAIDGDIRADARAGDPLEERILDPREKQRIAFELFHLSIMKRRALIAFLVREVFVTPRRRIELEKEPVVSHLAEHQRVDAAAEKH